MRAIFPLLFMALPGAAVAEEFTVGDLRIVDPVARESARMAMAGAGYMAIVNEGDTVDHLVAVRADFPRVMIHDTKMENDVATMFHIDAVEIAPGETVELAPGGMHVMFMGLQGDPLEAGETIPATLVFENAGEIDIEFEVIAANPAQN